MFGSELITSLLAIVLNYLATFILPSTSLLKDPVATLVTTVPVLLLGHLGLLALSNFLRGTTDRFLKTALYSTISTVVATCVLHFLAVLFGAPLIERVSNTFLFAAYLSILTIMPCFQSLESSVWIKVFVHHSPSTTSEIYAYAQAICALAGAWIGAIVLPLDWERDWQVWPISCIISTYVGHSVGVLAAFVWSSLKGVFGKKKNE
ncbi:GPI biosynthesis protein Pig-F [Sporodiniella umbellata]|nr:GPI biosynthesis protein Pig-F [Sporodiniella umbellata]